MSSQANQYGHKLLMNRKNWLCSIVRYYLNTVTTFDLNYYMMPCRFFYTGEVNDIGD